MQQDRFLGLMDMINGGGAGRAGDEFVGGPLSGLLNALGIRPRGYADRATSAPPATTYGNPAPTYAPPPPPPLLPAPAPPPGQYAPGAITQTALPPLGQMSDEQLIAVIRAALDRSAAPFENGRG